ncbi:HXXEE domain-containing protein [Paracoccus albus]|uniref:HXXEE domain-containing protein n=1 Tax=Paracoccus albus TaxID=3017784 RepID=UPI0022F1351D|nr:HXXEE domain-containing protein [Paracoccus albus]WBU61192.1 HXXEE domain-containing protein [Paracoccus albus]
MADNSKASNIDLGVGTGIALAMATVFTFASPGHALIVTFVPGVIVSWIIYLRLTMTGRPIPTSRQIIPVFALALAIQFLHFAEEFEADFQTQFPLVYEGEPISNIVFVAFNMGSYAVFLMSAVGVTFLSYRFLLVPMLFFAVYGVVGNAITHTLWAVIGGKYFPGLLTSVVYWALAPVLLQRFGLSRREAAVFIVALALVLIASAGLTLNTNVLRAAA